MNFADVCLVLEGTYPFVSGGVSSWVHQLVTKLDHLTFSLLHVSPKKGYYDDPVYQVPENVVGLQEVYLHDYTLPALTHSERMKKKVEKFRALMQDMQEGKGNSFTAFLDALQDEKSEGLDALDLLQSRESWDVLIDIYESEAHEESFLNFFWTWRFSNMPLFNILSANRPKAACYHTISTGYAGLMAAACRLSQNRPMLLTEHGIYAKERRIEINRASWIEDWDSGEVVAERKAPYFKRFWIRQFQMMSRICYEHADEIYTLYEGNRSMQTMDGADTRKIRIVPNGIDLKRFGEAAKQYDERPENDRYTVAFVGRVCPIKDVKTLIYAARLVAEEVPDVLFRIMGPWDEDPDYADQCKHLVGILDLEENIVFEGRVNVLEELWKTDLLVLTSISEAQPLVVLEAGAIGLPTVATDVGSCSELLFGRTLRDRKFGQGGLITPIATPGATAEALTELHREPERRKQMGKNMRSRVRTLYDQADMVSSYKEIYERNILKAVS